MRKENETQSRRIRGTSVLVAAGLVCAGLLGLQLAFAAAGGAGEPAGKDALAEKLVNQCAAIKEGDAVLISGGAGNQELLENIAVQVRKQGGFPLLTFGSDRLTKRMLDDVPAKYDSQKPSLDLALAGIIDAIISVDYGEGEGLLAHVPAERMAARAKAAQPVMNAFLKRGVRQVNLGNGLYPTEALAKRFGVEKEQLSKIFWDGVNVDYSKLQATGDAVRSSIASGKEIHITTPNGTDLKARIEGRQIFVSDGVITPEKIKKGGPASQTWLPAGEVYLSAVPGTAEGKVVVPRQMFRGKTIESLTLTFKAGKLTSMSAKAGLEPLKALYDASGEGKDVFGIIDLGINPNVHLVPGSRMDAWMPAGMVTVAFGANDWAGGENSSSFSLSSFLPGSTVTVDGKTLVEKGSLKM